MNLKSTLQKLKEKVCSKFLITTALFFNFFSFRGFVVCFCLSFFIFFMILFRYCFRFYLLFHEICKFLN